MLSDSLWSDSSDDDLLGDEFLEEDGDPDIVDTVPCPECGADIYEDTPRCPACGAYVTPDTSPWSDQPVWWIALGLLGIVAVLFVLIFATI